MPSTINVRHACLLTTTRNTQAFDQQQAPRVLSTNSAHRVF
jgi:hypothetical protein